MFALLPPSDPLKPGGTLKKNSRQTLSLRKKAPEEMMAEGNFEAPDQRGISSEPEERDDEPPDLEYSSESEGDTIRIESEGTKTKRI